MPDDLNNKVLRFQSLGKNRLIKALRERLHVTEEMVSDEKILEITRGILFRAGIELGFAFHDLLGDILCAIGLHKWKEQRTIEWKMEYVVAYLEGDVCSKCGKHRCDPAKVTEGLPQNYKVIGLT